MHFKKACSSDSTRIIEVFWRQQVTADLSDQPIIMPLQLTVHVQASSATSDITKRGSSSIPTSNDRVHCFVQLPADVAHSLNAIEPYAALLILDLRHIRTSRHVYVAWDGGTTASKSSHLDLHDRFAAALDFRNGDAISATVAERVITTPTSRHKTALQRAVIKPLSYHQPSHHDQHQQDYSVLSLTADSLQDSFLSCVRVLYPGLCFPLALPAGDNLLLQVVSIESHQNERNDDHRGDLPYAVVCPDSQIEIEPPPLEANSNKWSKPFFTRVAMVSRVKFMGLSNEILSTLAILNPVNDNDQSASHSSRPSCILVSRKGGEKHPDSNIAIPIRVIRHSAVSPSHIYLPPMAWHRLQLFPLTPVLVEPFSVSPHERTSIIHYIHTALSHDEIDMFPKIDDVARAGALFYDGMQTQEGIVRILNRSPRTVQNHNIIFPPLMQPWKDENLKKPEDSDLVHIDYWNDPLFYEGSSNPNSTRVKIPSSLRNNRIVLKSSFATVRPTHSLIEIPYKEDIGRPSLLISTPADGMPLRDEQIRDGFIQYMTPSIQKVVNDTFQTIKTWTRKHGNKHTSFAIAVEGASASGRTHLCEVLGSILQEVKKMRNIWIHGRKCHAEDVNLRLLRLYEAFQAACDEGPGVIIIDDFDLLYSSEKSDQSEKLSGQTENIEQKEECQVIAEWLHSLLTRHHVRRKHSVIVVLVCERVDDLVRSLRTTGLILHVASVESCSLEDRVFLFFKLMQKEYLKSKKISDVSIDVKGKSNDHKRILVKHALHMARLSDGYCVKDVFNCMKQAELLLGCNELDRLSELSEHKKSSTKDSHIISIVQVVEEAIRTLTPLHQMSSLSSVSTSKANDDNSSQKKHEERTGADTEDGTMLTWERLGGVRDIRETLVEVLELWTRNENILGMIPIRLTRGLLLYGPPGNGKTKIALTAAKQAGLSTIFVKGAELLGKYVGQSESEVRRVFERASSTTSHVIIFDEFDALASARGDSNAGVGDRVVNTLLACMDGVDRSVMNNVFVIATSSRPQIIDRALLRPGRLDKWIKVDFPMSAAHRMDILQCCYKYSFHHFSDGVKETLHRIATDSNGYSAADLEAIINDALNSLYEVMNEDSGVDSDHDGDAKETQQESSSTKTHDFDKTSIVNALQTAWENSRPSLSGNQRAYYTKMMAQFSGEEDMAGQVGQKLTLK